MRILFYSTKDYEQPFLEAANKEKEDISFINEALSLKSVEKSQGFNSISIFTADDASAPVLEALYNIGVRNIAVRAAGHDNVDIKKAEELGISVANVPEYSPYAIAEHATALILALNRKIITASKQVQVGNFTTGNLVGFDLHDKVVGIIGAGRIGSVFARIMKGFGCRLFAYDKVENPDLIKEVGIKYVDLQTLCSEADIISLHTCLTPETKYMLDKKLISKMKKGVMLINTGRGGCVNTIDVIEGLEKGIIGYFGADVYENEKGIFFYDHSGKEINDPLLKKLLGLPNVLVTPHQAFATKEALSNIASTSFYNIKCWRNNQLSENELTGIS